MTNLTETPAHVGQHLAQGHGEHRKDWLDAVAKATRNAPARLGQGANNSELNQEAEQGEDDATDSEAPARARLPPLVFTGEDEHFRTSECGNYRLVKLKVYDVMVYEAWSRNRRAQYEPLDQDVWRQLKVNLPSAAVAESCCNAHRDARHADELSRGRAA